MSRPPHAREKVLDAFESLLIAEGERAATMDALARAAGVSKGGRLSVKTRPFPPRARTSAMDGTARDRAILAVSRLAQAGRGAASDALRTVRERWADTLRPHVADKTAVDLVMLISDGVYYNNALQHDGLATPVPRDAEMDALVQLIAQAPAPRD